GVEQKATWLQVRQMRPDYVLLWGWGVMNSAAINEATAVGYPRNQMYGVWWSSAEPDVTPAGNAAIGFNGITLQASAEGDARMHPWDGQRWRYTSDWYQADMKVIRPLITASAKKFADESKISPRDCSKP